MTQQWLQQLATDTTAESNKDTALVSPRPGGGRATSAYHRRSTILAATAAVHRPRSDSAPDKVHDSLVSDCQMQPH